MPLAQDTYFINNINRLTDNFGTNVSIEILKFERNDVVYNFEMIIHTLILDHWMSCLKTIYGIKTMKQ